MGWKYGVGTSACLYRGSSKLKTKMLGHIFNKTLGLTECFLGIWCFFGSFRLFKAFKKFADIRNSQFYRYVPFQHIYKVDIISGGFTNFLTEFEWAKSLKKGQIISIDYFQANSIKMGEMIIIKYVIYILFQLTLTDVDFVLDLMKKLLLHINTLFFISSTLFFSVSQIGLRLIMNCYEAYKGNVGNLWHSLKNKGNAMQ